MAPLLRHNRQAGGRSWRVSHTNPGPGPVDARDLMRPRRGSRAAGPGKTSTLTGTPLRLLLTQADLVAVTISGGRPTFTRLPW
jgi:hypothetical protein